MILKYKTEQKEKILHKVQAQSPTSAGQLGGALATLMPQQPIGIFDSGVGGLTVAKAVVELLPHESIIYFGDTAHLPYGDKSAATIQGYALQITEMLLQQQCKMILIACNSISAAAYDAINGYINGRALLVNVIDPMVAYLVEHYANKVVGLIGTRQTVKSDIYQQKLAALNRYACSSGMDKGSSGVTLRALATPLLVPIIEEGFFSHALIDLALREYLSHHTLANIDALVLGCTHYPIIKESIGKYYANAVDIIDASHIVARAVKQLLEQHGLLNRGAKNVKVSGANGARVGKMGNESSSSGGLRQFYVSDYTDAFAAGAKLFFGDGIDLREWRAK
jgi:glutamate racemase